MRSRLAIHAMFVVALASGAWVGGAVPASGDGGGFDSSQAANEPVQRLTAEVRSKGWIAYAARSEKGDWDLFLCRPDGSQRRHLTATPEHNEFSPQFSRDGRRLLYRRTPLSEKIDDNLHGTQGELVIANSDATDPKALGRPGDYSWASWSPDGKLIACLSIKGISFVDVAAGRTLRMLERRGFFQQMTWSPDGQWLIGVANSFGASWSIARMNVITGLPSAVNRVDCCTPDWFPDSQQVIFSWRPRGQEANNGYGWTQLWRADATGRTRQLVYGEDGRHVYGGHVSPDGKYVLFTGNMNEDGDPGNAGAPMSLMRLADAPIIGGESRELRALHPEARDGPVLTLPAGWEPCWTFSELPVVRQADGAPGEVEALATELRGKGWIGYSAKTEQGDWDVFLIRPDGSDRRKLTDTREFNEAGVRFSPNGKRLLYYRMPRTVPVDNNTYGTFDLVVAEADGSRATNLGNAFHWASWSPDGTRLACVAPTGIQIVEVATRKVVRELPRRGIIQQLVWSPDGKRFAGTANGLGQFWNIGCLSAESGDFHAVSETDRYNCTPDWTPDSQCVLYARGVIPNRGGRAELWLARRDGRSRQTLYAEEARHIYGACTSPDSKYVLFTRSVEDLGRVDNSRTTMAVIRWSDTPMIGDASVSLRKRLPDAKNGPRLDLGPGWEPHWTFADLSKTAGKGDK